jgi:hypothetical protein
MIHPYLFVGVGGSGGKTLRAVKQELTRFLVDNGWDFERHGFPITWQFLNVDTPANQGREGFPAEPLTASEYLGLAGTGQSLDNMLTAIEGKFAYAESVVREEVMTPLPRRGSFTKLIDEGAGQYRAIGRTVAIARFNAIREAVGQSLANMQGPMWQEHQAALAKLLGEKNENDDAFKPTIFLISSMAGGSGSGQFLEVSEAIKAARPSDAWAGEQIAILYAPDVFDDPKISVDAGIAPNSLAAIGELVSAKWRKSPTEVNSHIYSANGFADFTSKTNYKVGPSDIFLFGKSAGNVVFGSQNEVYLATATSLAHWVTDPTISEWFNVFQKMNQQSSPDRAGLMVDSHLPLPLNALGFSRVTLGTELFRDYAVGRLSRATLDALVNGHERAAGSAEKSETEDQKIDKLVKQRIQNFVNELQITPEQIARSLQPDSKITDWVATFRSDLANRAGVNAGQNQKALDWIAKIRGAINQTSPLRRSEWEAIRQGNVSEWAKETQKRINRIVVQDCGIYGLRTVESMLTKVIAGVSANLKSSQDALNQIVDPAVAVEQALKESPGALSANSDLVTKAVQDAVFASRDMLKAEDIRFARKLLEDLVTNYLVPLRETLARAHRLYLEMVTTADYQGTGESRFKSWPTENTVPEAPAQNIKLLMAHTQFKTDFDDMLVSSTRADSERQAVKVAVGEILSGSEYIRGMEEYSDRSQTWKAFGNDSLSWMPSGGNKPASRWSGELPKDLDDWQLIVEKYVEIPHRPLGKHLRLNLHDWLNPEDVSLKNKREDEFSAAFASALNMCQPFAKLNRSLLSEVHGLHDDEYSITPTQIPVDAHSATSTLPQRLKDILAKKGIVGEAADKMFRGELANVKTIDFFAALKAPVHHFVFDNLTQPIIQGWNIAKLDPGLRQAFMLRRRARLLPEAIPLAPEILEQLLRGWYVGRLLGRLKEEIVPGGLQGPKLYVHQEDPARAGWEPLPFPLFQNSGVFPGNEYPALVAYSTSIALIECADAGSMKPWAPYRSLMLLGGSVSLDNIPDNDGRLGKPIELCVALQQWIRTGVPVELAPSPLADRAGNAAMSSAERLDVVRKFFEGEKSAFLRDHVDLAAGQPHSTLAWQLRREIVSALDTLIAAASSFSPSSSNV